MGRVSLLGHRVRKFGSASAHAQSCAHVTHRVKDKRSSEAKAFWKDRKAKPIDHLFGVFGSRHQDDAENGNLISRPHSAGQSDHFSPHMANIKRHAGEQQVALDVSGTRSLRVRV